MSVPSNIDHVIPTVQTPTSPSDPSYNPALDPAQILSTDGDYYKYTTSSISFAVPYPTAIRLNATSVAAITELETGQPVAYYASTVLDKLVRYDVTTQTVLLPLPILGFENNDFDSLAVSQTGGVTIIADALAGNGHGWSVNPITGAGTEIFTSNGGGTAPGQFSNALYQDYGPNGLLYVLDYGNQRVQALDPANGFAPVSQFALQSGLANMPFAIAPNGNFYFGNGDGGGQAYSATGTYEGSFTTTVSSTIPGLSNAPYLNTDANGDVYVFDSTGAHIFLDTSAVPEPATWALFVLGLSGLFAMRRRFPSR